MDALMNKINTAMGVLSTSGLDERIYTFIADNEDKFFGKENENVKDRKD